MERSTLTLKIPQENSLHVGGVVAMGLSRDGDYLLVVSHSGRGVYSACDWKRVARDDELSYPENGEAIGIGPIVGERVQVTEMNYGTGQLRLETPDGRMQLEYESGTIDITLIET